MNRIDEAESNIYDKLQSNSERLESKFKMIINFLLIRKND